MYSLFFYSIAPGSNKRKTPLDLFTTFLIHKKYRAVKKANCVKNKMRAGKFSTSLLPLRSNYSASYRAQVRLVVKKKLIKHWHQLRLSAKRA